MYGINNVTLQARLELARILDDTDDWISSHHELGQAAETLKQLTHDTEQLLPETMVSKHVV